MSLSLSAILVATALRGTLDLSNRAQLSTRAGGTLAGPALDADTSPEVKLGVRSKRWQLTLDYAPRFTGSLAGADTQSYVLQQGRIGARFQDRRASLSLSQDSGYGRLSLLTLGAYPGATPGAPATTPQLAALPSTAIVDYAWSRTGIVARLVASRRWALSFTGDLALSGGVGAASRASLPFQTTLRAGIGSEYAASRQDRVTATLGASSARFSSGPEDTLVEGKVSWRRDLDRATAATLAGGIGWSASRTDTAPSARATASPILEAGLSYRPRASSLDFGLTLRLGPVIDAFRGTVDPRVEGSGIVTWTPTREVAIQGQLGVARTLPSGEGIPVSFGSGGLMISYRVSEMVQIDGGARSAWTEALGSDSPPQWMAFGGLTVRIPTINF